MPVETLAPPPASNSAVAIPAPAPTVAEVLSSIAADAAAAAGEYLRDTEVPHGGE